MKRNHFFLSIFIFTGLVFLSSCEQDNPTNNNTNNTVVTERCRVRKVTYYPQPGSQREFEFIYRDSVITNMIETTQMPYGSPEYIINFYYDTSLLTHQVFLHRVEYNRRNDPQISYSQTFFNDVFDGAGAYRTSFDSLYDDNINQLIYNGYTSYGYKIDLNTFMPILHEIEEYSRVNNTGNVGLVQKYTWLNGNIVKTIASDINGDGTDQIEYDTTRINKFRLLHPEHFMQGFMNMGLFTPNLNYLYMSKNMLKSITSTNPNRPQGTFTYTYNNEGLMNEIIFNGTLITKYEYTCD